MLFIFQRLLMGKSGGKITDAITIIITNSLFKMIKVIFKIVFTDTQNTLGTFSER